MNPGTLFLVNVASTWYMVGLIWMVQVVHYELFDRVGVEGFARYEADHSRLITPIVGVPMILELITSLALVTVAQTFVPRWAAWLGLVMVVAIWGSTALLQVPCHGRLTQGFDLETYRMLVRSNWIRTALWTGRGLLMGFFAWKVFAERL